MKKVLTLSILVLALGFLASSANASTYYGVITKDDYDADADAGHVTGKSVTTETFWTSSNCDTGNWAAGAWDSNMIVAAGNGGPAILMMAWFVDSGSYPAPSKGTNLSSINYISGYCTNVVSGGGTKTFKKFSAAD